MLKRCFNPNDDHFDNYMGRGITVCDEWRDSFEAFHNWALANGYRDDLSIDRIDVNGNYCPENCRWADASTQQRNRRITAKITYEGETKTLFEWAEIKGIRPEIIRDRLRNGWDVERVFTQKVRKHHGSE